MLDGMRTVGVPSCLFFFAVHLIGNFLMLNLFVAFLLSSFEQRRQELEDMRMQRVNSAQVGARLL